MSGEPLQTGRKAAAMKVWIVQKVGPQTGLPCDHLASTAVRKSAELHPQPLTAALQEQAYDMKDRHFCGRKENKCSQ